MSDRDDFDDEDELGPDEDAPELPADVPDTGEDEFTREPRPAQEPAEPSAPAGPAGRTKGNKGTRITKAELALRHAQVATMLLSGLSRGDVLQFIATERATWDVKERQIDYYIAAANKIIEREAARDVNREKGKAALRLDTLYRKSLGAKLYGTALRVQRAINRLHGLEAPTTTKLRHGSDPESPLPPGTTVIVEFSQRPEGVVPV